MVSGVQCRLQQQVNICNKRERHEKCHFSLCPRPHAGRINSPLTSTEDDADIISCHGETTMIMVVVMIAMIRG